MKTAGVVFDFYDDPSGSILKTIFTSPEELPEKVKTAHILNQDERHVLRDDAYALVMVNDGIILRKFACVDPGNTILSMNYLEKTAGSLPEVAIRDAAARMMEFCSEYGIDPTPFIKAAAKEDPEGKRSSATGMHRDRDSFKQPMVGDEADWAARTNLVSLRGGTDSGRVIPMASQMKTAGEFKSGYYGNAGGHVDFDKGEMTITPGHPEDFPKAEKFNMHLYDKARVEKDKHMHGKKYKLASADQGVLTDDKRNIGVTSPAPKLQNTLEQSNGLGTPTVIPDAHPKYTGITDVTGKQPKHKFEKKSSTRYALNGRYPLDSYQDVKKAVEYFSDNWTEMDPDDRHEYCVKTASRAEELGIPTTPLMDRYGSTLYAPDIEAHLVSRQAVCKEEWKGVYGELLEKRASVEPEAFAKMLAKVDEVSGLNHYWGGQVTDPWLATFGGMTEKKAADDWSWKSNTGDMVSAASLKKLALEGRPLVHKQFTKDIADAFSKDPITIFNSLPDTQKKILCNMANGEFDGPSMN